MTVYPDSLPEKLAESPRFVALLTRRLAPLPESNLTRRFFEGVATLEKRDMHDPDVLGRVAAEFYDHHFARQTDADAPDNGKTFLARCTLSQKETLRTLSYERDPEILSRRAFLESGGKKLALAAGAALAAIGMAGNKVAARTRDAAVQFSQKGGREIVFDNDGNPESLNPNQDLVRFVMSAEARKKADRLENASNVILLGGAGIAAYGGLRHAIGEYRLVEAENAHDLRGDSEHFADIMLQQTDELLVNAIRAYAARRGDTPGKS